MPDEVVVVNEMTKDQAIVRLFYLDKELAALREERQTKVQKLDEERAAIVDPYNVKIQAMFEERKKLQAFVEGN